jgi:RNA polymerase-binding transcription factor DksA
MKKAKKVNVVKKQATAPKAKAKAKAPAKPAPKAAPKPAAPAPAPEAPPKKLKLSKDDAAKYRRLLLELRDHLIDGVSFLASDNLKRSNRDASGELSGYSLHMADAGTDNFDREFALSLVSNEQDALYEIEEAIKRLEFGTYGICEMCEKLIRKERLEAVPFARKCVQCQSVSERENHRRPAPVTGIFSENAEEEGEEKEESEEKEKD